MGIERYGGLAQMAERSLSMREALGSMPRSSTYGQMAERSKALHSSCSQAIGVGSNPTLFILLAACQSVFYFRDLLIC